MPEALAAPEAEDTTLDSAFTDAAALAPESPAPAETTPAAPPAAEASPYLERARSAGLELDGIDSNEKLIDTLLDQIQKNQPYIQAGQQVFAQPLRLEPAAEAEKPAEEFDHSKYFAEKWNVPKWDDNFTRAIQAGWVQQDEAGKWVAVPGAEMLVAPLLTPLNQAHAAKQQAVQSLFQGNFYEQLYTNLLEPMRREWAKDFQQNIGQFQQTTQQEQYLSQFEKEHGAWLYKPGSQELTEQGQKFNSHVVRLQQQYRMPLAAAVREVFEMTGAPAKAAAPAAPAAPPVIPPTVAEKSNGKKQTFLDNAAKRAGHAPQSRGYTQASPSDPAVMSKGELETLFVREAAQSSSV